MPARKRFKLSTSGRQWDSLEKACEWGVAHAKSLGAGSTIMDLQEGVQYSILGQKMCHVPNENLRALARTLMNGAKRIHATDPKAAEEFLRAATACSHHLRNAVDEVIQIMEEEQVDVSVQPGDT